MDGLRLPPLIEEVLDSADELKDLELPLRGVNAWKDPQSVQGEQKPEAQMLQLMQELKKSKEESRRHQQSFMELQGLLEDERLTSAQQAETFSRQVHKLQGELQTVREQLDTVQGEKDRELEEARQEVLLLSQEVEDASCDVALLQEELCRLRAGQEVTALREELQQVLTSTAQYQQEVTSLRAELSLKRNADQGDETGLQEELTALTSDQSQLSTEEENLQPEPTDGLYLAVSGQTGSYVSVSEGESAGEQEMDTLKVQLRRAEDKIHRVEHVCDGLRRQLSELQREREELQQELQRLIGSKTQSRPAHEPPAVSASFIGVVVIVALIWCWWEELAS